MNRTGREGRLPAMVEDTLGRPLREHKRLADFHVLSEPRESFSLFIIMRFDRLTGSQVRKMGLANDKRVCCVFWRIRRSNRSMAFHRAPYKAVAWVGSCGRANISCVRNEEATIQKVSLYCFDFLSVKEGIWYKR